MKGDTKTRRTGARVAVYRHHDAIACPGWPVKEVPASVLEDQVGEMFRGARPNRESAARVRAALASPPAGPDRLAVARVDSRLRELGLELAQPEPTRPAREVLEEMDDLRAERAAIQARPVDVRAVSADEALGYLEDLGTLWADTDDEGRRALVLGAFPRLGARSGWNPRSHRIVDVEPTPEAERRGLSLALPTRLGVTLVGDTGFEPVTSRM